MAGQKFFALAGTVFTALTARQTGFGNAANAGQLVATGADDRLDMSVMPAGIGADTFTCTATEALAAGAYVNLYGNAGATVARNADSSAANVGKQAHGFVQAAVAANGQATVYMSGQNVGVTGQTPGSEIYLGAGGAGAMAPDTASGHTYQRIGVATAAGDVAFRPFQPILIS